MSNSQNDSLEDVPEGTKESIEKNVDSPSNKKTRFTKSKSISEVFKELEDAEDSNVSQVIESEKDVSEFGDMETAADSDFEDIETVYDSDYDDEFEDIESVDESIDNNQTIDLESSNNDEVDEIIPIHNEYDDLDKSEAFDADSTADEDTKSSELDTYIESIVDESDDFSSIEHSDSKENLESISEDGDSDDSIDSDDINEEDFDDENIKHIKIKDKKPSSDGVVLNKDGESKKSGLSFEFDSTFIITVLGLVIGIGILIMGIFYFNSSSDRVVDNVLSGETAGLAVFLIIIGLLIIGFSILRFISSSKADDSSSMLDMFHSIRDIDYDDVKEDSISRDDFDSVFSSVLGKDKRSNFSTDDGDNDSDQNSDLFERDEKVSDEDIEALYSKSNIKSQKTSSFKNQSDDSIGQDESFDDVSIDSDDDNVVLDSDNDDEMTDSDDNSDSDKSGEYDDFVNDLFGSQDDDADSNSDDFDDDADSKVNNMSNLKDKYAKYDFSEDSDDEESKPKFKKSVDISKFDGDNLSQEELEAERLRKKEELAEKKRRIIQGTNFDNSLRK